MKTKNEIRSAASKKAWRSRKRRLAVFQRFPESYLRFLAEQANVLSMRQLVKLYVNKDGKMADNLTAAIRSLAPGASKDGKT